MRLAEYAVFMASLQDSSFDYAKAKKVSPRGHALNNADVRRGSMRRGKTCCSASSTTSFLAVASAW